MSRTERQKEIDSYFDSDKNLYCCKLCVYTNLKRGNFLSHLNKHDPSYREKKRSYDKAYVAKKVKENSNFHTNQEQKRKVQPAYKNRKEQSRKSSSRLTKKDRRSGKAFACDFEECQYTTTSRATLRSHKFSKHSESEKSYSWNMRHTGLAHYIKKNNKKFKADTSKPSDPNFTTETPRVLELCQILNDKWPSSYKKEHYLYFVAVVEIEAKKLGLYLYLDKYKNDPTKIIKIYVGVSPDGCPSHYHTDEAKCQLSSIAKLCQQNSGYCAIYYRYIKISTGKDHEENMTLAHKYESQYQLAMQIRETVELKPGLIFEPLNKRLELSSLAKLSEVDRQSAIFVGTTGLSPIILDSDVGDQDFLLENFCGGKPFTKVFKRKNKTEVLEFPIPLIPFPDSDD